MEQTATGMFKGLPVGEHIFEGVSLSAPLLEERFVRTYIQSNQTYSVKESRVTQTAPTAISFLGSFS